MADGSLSQTNVLRMRTMTGSFASAVNGEGYGTNGCIAVSVSRKISQTEENMLSLYGGVQQCRQSDLALRAIIFMHGNTNWAWTASGVLAARKTYFRDEERSYCFSRSFVTKPIGLGNFPFWKGSPFWRLPLVPSVSPCEDRASHWTVIRKAIFLFPSFAFSIWPSSFFRNCWFGRFDRAPSSKPTESGDRKQIRFQ